VNRFHPLLVALVLAGCTNDADPAQAGGAINKSLPAVKTTRDQSYKVQPQAPRATQQNGVKPGGELMEEPEEEVQTRPADRTGAVANTPNPGDEVQQKVQKVHQAH
jgi:hypothetical protein